MSVSPKESDNCVDLRCHAKLQWRDRNWADVGAFSPGVWSHARMTIMATDNMMAQVSGRDGFIAALDRSGGSTPGAVRLHGIPDTT
jgi:hypothetical protein